MSLLFPAEERSTSRSRSRSPPFSSARWAARAAAATAATAAELAAVNAALDGAVARFAATPTTMTTTTATTTASSESFAGSAIALAYAHGFEACRSRMSTSLAVEFARVGRPGAFQQGFEDGYAAGVERRTAVLPQPAPPPVSTVPPRSVRTLMLGHACWVVGVTSPDSEDFAIAIMARDWLLSLG